MTFGKLGSLGVGFGRLGSGGSANDPLAPAAPVLTWDTGPTDNTPQFTSDFDDTKVHASGDIDGSNYDVIELNWDTDPAFGSPDNDTNTLDAAEILAGEVAFTTGALADGTWYARTRHNHVVAGVNHYSPWSNTVSQTIDATAPTVSSFSPADNATGVAVDATLVVTFSEPVALGASGTITLKKTSDDSTVDSWDVSADEGSGAGQLEVLNDDELNLHLTTDIDGGLEVYVIWDAGVVKDIAGNNVAALSTTTTWSFTTASTYEAEAVTLFAAMSSQPDNTRKAHINTFIAALKTAGIWAKGDVLYCAGHDEQASLLNWIDPGTFDGTASGSPTFTADEGWAGASGKHVSTGYTPSTAGGNLTQNSCCVLAWAFGTLSSSSGGLFGSVAAVNGISCFPNFIGEQFLSPQGAYDSAGRAVGTSDHLYGFSRLNSSEAIAVSGATHETFSNTSTSLNASVIAFGRRGVAGETFAATNKYSMLFIGGGLSTGELTDFHTAAAAYMSGL
jgi:hypothetical protein